MKNDCVISICMPIYNRLDSFKYVFTRLIDQVQKLETKQIEIVVSVNPSDKTDATVKYLNEERERYAFIVNVNERNIGGDYNILTAMKIAKGKYVWVVGDDDLILPGVVKRILTIVNENMDITWMFLPSARLNGFPNDEMASVVSLNYGSIKPGLYKDGKETIIKAHKKMDGQLLFSSSNIFLREIALEVAQNARTISPQLGSTFASAAKGSAYFEKKICILAGGEIAWGDIAAYNYMIRYHDDLLSCVGHGYTEKEIHNLIKYRMSHAQIVLWFVIYREILKGNTDGRDALISLLKISPTQTILTLLFSPIVAIYLFIRHKYHDFIRKRITIKYLDSDYPDPIVASRISRLERR